MRIDKSLANPLHTASLFPYAFALLVLVRCILATAVLLSVDLT